MCAAGFNAASVLVLLYIKVLLLEIKAFSMHVRDTIMPYFFQDVCFSFVWESSTCFGQTCPL